MKISLRTKLIAAVMVIGLLPLAFMSMITFNIMGRVVEDAGNQNAIIARMMMDSVERNMFERYGDVQAFAINSAIRDVDSWYQPGAEKNKIVAAMNKLRCALCDLSDYDVG